MPSVAALQILLNHQYRGSLVAVDGIYGPKTQQATRDFQKGEGLSRDGVVGKMTWPRLIQGTGLKVIDAIDITDPDHFRLTAKPIMNLGGNPIMTGASCNGVGDMLHRIMGRVGPRELIVLLRFHGHGAGGIMGVSDGEGYYVDRHGRTVYIDPDLHGTSLTLKTLKSYFAELTRLRNFFAGFGSVELHGCKVARGSDGRMLVQRLANLLGVPVSAGKRNQIFGGRFANFRFEGPIYTAFPKGTPTLKLWSKAADATSSLFLPQLSV